jgi:hypothetical protein
LHRIPHQVGCIARRTASQASESLAGIVLASLRADAEVELADFNVFT